MKVILSLIFCFVQAFLVAKFGWLSILWSPIGLLLGLFISANVILPLFVAVPKITRLVAQERIQKKAFVFALLTPVLWFIAFFLFKSIFPAWFRSMVANEPLQIGFIFGTVMILFSPFNKKGVNAINRDFADSYGRYMIGSGGMEYTFINA